MELTAENATRGKQSLKLTFAGGRWPTITTTDIPEDWMPYALFGRRRRSYGNLQRSYTYLALTGYRFSADYSCSGKVTLRAGGS